MDEIVIPQLPRLDPWYRIGRHDGMLALEYGQSVVVFEGEAATGLLPELLPLLDGTRRLEDVQAAFGEAAAPAVANALALLAGHGLLTEGPPVGSGSAAETASLLSATGGRQVAPAEVVGSLVETHVALVGSSQLAEEVARCLLRSGVGGVIRVDWDDRPNGALSIAAPRPAELPLLADWSRATLEAGASWVPVLPFDGRMAAIGPLIVPGETCCWECFRLRRASNLDWSEEFWALESVPASYPTTPALDAVVAGVTTWLALRWIVLHDADLPGVMVAVEHDHGLALDRHVVYRVPRCPACSGLERLGAPLPWYEKSRVEDERV